MRSAAKDKPALALLDAALTVQDTSGLHGLAEQVGRLCGAVGCVIWYVEPTLVDGGALPDRSDALTEDDQAISRQAVDLTDRTLGPLAWWFEGEVPTLSAQPMSSQPGQAVAGDVKGRRAGNPIVTPALDVIDADATSCAIHLRAVPAADTDRGALTVFHRRPTTPPEDATLGECAALMSRVLETTFARLHLATLAEVGERVGRDEPPARFDLDEPNEHDQIEAVEKLLLDVCEIVRRRLNCDEVTIRLRGHAGADPKAADLRWIQASLLPDAPRPDKGGGLTGWVVGHARTLWMPDLRVLDTEAEHVRELLPTLDFEVGNYLLSEPRQEQVARTQNRSEAVCSFVAVPVIERGHAVGAVRASLATVPAHFSARDVELLDAVAKRIGGYWEIARARLQFRIAHSETKDLDEKARAYLASESSPPDSREPMFAFLEVNEGAREIIVSILDALERVVPNATTNSFRVLRGSGATRRLQFVIGAGSTWPADANGAPAVIGRTFALHGDAKSLGRWVVDHRDLRARDFAVASDDWNCDPTFDKTRYLLCAPVYIADEVFGVLDLRSFDAPFTEDAARTLRYFAMRLGSFLGAAREVNSQQAHVATQRRMIDDLVHQIITPLRLAGRRIDRQVRAARRREETTEDQREAARHAAQAQSWWSVSRLTARASTVARSLELYRQLEDPDVALVTGDDVTMSGNEIRTLLEQLIADTEMYVDPDQQLTFRLTSTVRANEFVACDPDHLEQCIFQLLDNACKYSWHNRDVLVRAHHGTGGCEITVETRGQELHTGEIDRVRVRGFRGEHALQTTSEGQGIGLWLVDELMRANGGELHVRASGDVTTVILALPWRRGRDRP